MKDNNPLNSFVTPNILYQGGQASGDDVHVLAPRQDGNVINLGNWTWESPNAVDAITKTNNVTKTDDTQYYAIPNFREIHRSSIGAYATGAGTDVLGFGADNIWGSGWTQIANHITTNNIDVGGTLTIGDSGIYLCEYSGFLAVSAGAGFITQVSCKFNVSGTYNFSGGTSFTFAAAAAVTRCAYTQRTILQLNNGQTIRPAYVVATSAAATVTLNSGFLHYEPLYFGS